jgi:hypothetical protein
VGCCVAASKNKVRWKDAEGQKTEVMQVGACCRGRGEVETGALKPENKKANNPPGSFYLLTHIILLLPLFEPSAMFISFHINFIVSLKSRHVQQNLLIDTLASLGIAAIKLISSSISYIILCLLEKRCGLCGKGFGG